ncbi:hypothetical protein OSSY52_05860 [Tepiditoga spiralis]|uniref:Anti-sigma-28 factor FlgM C-terminal domain-containing protein n=1 Tax=Tepiditoga spiralis TaxID=2108365 RepID=A0A7G1G380_9BACT|nr:flagellar biosynthesis anti-sigma factor FlgM [Tepiditoga spiralis]BBE30445.1 hypothetical protein OSSY52_05860 [Tepiditoga spiralis]
MDIRRIESQQSLNMKRIQDNKLKSIEKNKKEKIETPLKISGESKKYIEIAKSLPETRTSLINSIKEAIDNGLYKINSNKIAELMLGDR